MSGGDAVLEILRISDQAWRVRDMTRLDHPCPIVAVIDCVDDAHRVLWLDAPTEEHLYRTLTDAVDAVEARMAGSAPPPALPSAG